MERPLPPRLREKGGESPRLSTVNSPRESPRISAVGTAVSGSPRNSPRLRSSPRNSPRDSPRTVSAIEKVTSELMQTEKTYLRDLELLIQIYLEPLRKSYAKSPRVSSDMEDVSDLLSEQDINGIFSNVQQVLGVNKALLEALEKDQTVGNVAAAFTQMAEYLKVYSIYCSNQDSALRLVEENEKKPRFQKWMKANQSKMISRGLDLRDFLIKPAQRICKYPLFLRELIDSTPADSDTKKLLLDVNAKIQAVVTHINEQRRLKEGLEGVAEVYQKLGTDYPLITAQRVLVYKGSGPLREIGSFGSTIKSQGPGTTPRGGSEVEERKGSFLGGLKRMSRRGSSLSDRPASPSSSSSSVSSMTLSPTTPRSGSGVIRTSSSFIDAGDIFLKETHLFLFNDLFLFCRPRKKGQLLDVVFEISPDKIRAKMGESDSFMLRLLRDDGPDVSTKYVFQCKDFVEQEGWMEVFDKINPYTTLSERSRARNPATLPIIRELDWTRARHSRIERQAALLGERLKMIQMKVGKLKNASDAGTDEVLEKFSALAYSLPQWKYQAKELKRLSETTLDWLNVLLPHAKYSKKLEEAGEAKEAVTLVSLRKHQQKLEQEKRAAADSPPPLPERCESDYEEFEEYEEEEEYYDDVDDDLDLDKLSAVLKRVDIEGKSPERAKQGPDGVKKRRVKRRVKVKRRRKKSVASLPKSAPKKPVPPPPTVPDYPTENLTAEVREEITRYEGYVKDAVSLHNGYKDIETEIGKKVEALTPLAQISKSK